MVVEGIVRALDANKKILVVEDAAGLSHAYYFPGSRAAGHAEAVAEIAEITAGTKVRVESRVAGRAKIVTRL